MEKKFKLTKDQILPLVSGYGGCIATDMITVEGYSVRFMYRESYDSNRREDSGWRFMSGLESEEYMNDPKNHGVYDVNTIANYDPSIIPFLDAPAGSVFEKQNGEDHFVKVEDFPPPEE